MDVELNSHKIQNFSLSWHCLDRDHASLNAQTEWTTVQDEKVTRRLNAQISHKIKKFSLSWRCPDREHASLNVQIEWTIVQDESVTCRLNG